ncbi:MAG TPA: hypothetical protein PLU49_10680, partial [Saprospiraceae bacterium]|nr:hypothetical protein [Saprospiraceae bacterium]
MEGDFIGADAEVVDKGIAIELYRFGSFYRISYRECFDQLPPLILSSTGSGRTRSALREPVVDLEFHQRGQELCLIIPPQFDDPEG